MKRSLFPIMMLCIALSSCCTDEIGPDINFSDFTLTDTTYLANPVPAPQIKHLLVEESTGVNCPNCPKGTQVLNDLDAQYNNRLDIISIHYGGNVLNEPHHLRPDLDLRPPSDVGDAYISFLGGIAFQPEATIDRQEVNDNLMSNRTNWAGLVAQRIDDVTDVNIDLNTSVDDGNELLILNMKLTYTKTPTDTTADFYSIVILEHDIEGAQDSSGYDLEPYIFNDVFRSFITPISGEKIIAERVAGRVIEKEFGIPFEDLADWNRGNLAAVVFVHKISNNNMTVLNSREVHF